MIDRHPVGVARVDTAPAQDENHDPGQDNNRLRALV